MTCLRGPPLEPCQVIETLSTLQPTELVSYHPCNHMVTHLLGGALAASCS